MQESGLRKGPGGTSGPRSTAANWTRPRFDNWTRLCLAGGWDGSGAANPSCRRHGSQPGQRASPATTRCRLSPGRSLPFGKCCDAVPVNRGEGSVPGFFPSPLQPRCQGPLRLAAAGPGRVGAHLLHEHDELAHALRALPRCLCVVCSASAASCALRNSGSPALAAVR